MSRCVGLYSSLLSSRQLSRGIAVRLRIYDHILQTSPSCSSAFAILSSRPLSSTNFQDGFRRPAATQLRRFWDFLNVRARLPGRLNNENSSSQKDKGMAQQGANASDSAKKEEEFEEEDEEGGEKNKAPKFNKNAAVLFFVGGLVAALLLMNSDVSDTFPELTWSDFVSRILPTGQVANIVVYPSFEKAVIYMNQGARDTEGRALKQAYRLRIPSVNRFEEEMMNAITSHQLPHSMTPRVIYQHLDGAKFVGTLIGIGFLVFLFTLFRKGLAKSFNVKDVMAKMGRAKINVIDSHGIKKLKIRFNDVAGLHEAKTEIREFLDYLKNPGKYTKLGAKLPKGALLTGPPGCGKTLLAKALAAESSVPFISINGTDFVEMIGGLGASRVRDLFKEAKSRAPCIVYIDEIDAVGRKRGDPFAGMDGGEADQTLNQLLVAMDGMDSANGVVVLASTNRADILDKALLRPGRFDRHILIDLPTASEREEMFELYLSKIKLDREPKAYSKRLAAMTSGFSGAGINTVVNEAAIRAASYKKTIVTIKELDYALQRTLAGAEKRSQTMVKEEKEIVAYHEAGHALVGWLLKHTDALLKVSIIPRTSSALGSTQYSHRDRFLFSKEELFERMCMSLGGRAAENIAFSRVSTGAQDDLEKVRKSAYAQVKIYGMSEKVGPLSFAPQPGTGTASEFQKKPYSSSLQHLMDQEAMNLVSQAYYETEQLLRDHRGMLDKLAQALLEKEVLNYEDVKALIGPPKFGDKHLVELADHILPKPEDIRHQI